MKIFQKPAHSPSMDREFGAFFRSLEEKNFFDKGLLVVVSDHRSMTPLRNEEQNLCREDRAVARIPLFILGKGITPAVYPQQFQQADLAQGLINRVSNQHCSSDWVLKSQALAWHAAGAGYSSNHIKKLIQTKTIRV